MIYRKVPLAMKRLTPTRAELQARGITDARIAFEVKRLFPDRTCTRQMANMVVNGRAKSVFVDVAIARLLEQTEKAG